MPLLASRSLPLLAKCKLYSACVVSDILYGGETWPLKEEGLIRIEGNDARMVRVMMQDVDLKIGLLARNSAFRGLPVATKGRLYFAYVCSAMLYGGKTWSLKGKDLIKVARNDTRMVKWICNVMSEGRIPGEELGARLKLKNMRECLQDIRLE